MEMQLQRNRRNTDITRPEVLVNINLIGVSSPCWNLYSLWRNTGRFLNLGMVSGVKGRHVSPSRACSKNLKISDANSCNFVLKYSKLSIDFSAPLHSLKSLLFAGEAWNLIGSLARARLSHTEERVWSNSYTDFGSAHRT